MTITKINESYKEEPFDGSNLSSFHKANARPKVYLHTKVLEEEWHVVNQQILSVRWCQDYLEFSYFVSCFCIYIKPLMN